MDYSEISLIADFFAIANINKIVDWHFFELSDCWGQTWSVTRFGNILLFSDVREIYDRASTALHHFINQLFSERQALSLIFYALIRWDNIWNSLLFLTLGYCLCSLSDFNSPWISYLQNGFQWYFMRLGLTF